MESLQPFTCYFCNKNINNDSQQGHISICGSVLVACPHKCGSYVQRIELHNHQSECKNRVTKQTNSLSRNNRETTSLDKKSSSVDYYEQLLFKVREEVQQLNFKVSHFEHDFKQNVAPQQLQMCEISQRQHKQEIDKLKYQQHYLHEWKKAIDLKLETLQQSLKFCQDTKQNNDTQMLWLQQKSLELNQLRNEIRSLQDAFQKNYSFNTQENLTLASRLEEFNDFFQQENATIGALWNDNKTMIDNIGKDMFEVKKSINEQKTKFATALFDIKTTTQIVSESTEKLEILEKEFKQFKRNLEQIKLDLEILEDLVSNQGEIAPGMPGFIIWKIDDFNHKMSTAKENEHVLKSRIFYSHNFGYRMRILVYLNGLKKWKDRYTLISIQILKGDFDELLKWPCHVEGTVTLRDQTDLENPKNFTKYIAAKRQQSNEENEEPQESSVSYIFIPHTTLLKSTYLKNDAIFLDIKINQSGKHSIETTL